MVGSTPVYSIGTVAETLGIPASTLRTWEDRYGLVVPTRSEGGHRLYSRQDLERLRFIAGHLAEGMQPGEAHRLLADQVRAGSSLTEAAPEAPRLGILLAERDPYSAELADYFLRTEGYEVTVAFSSVEAEAKFDLEKPELVIIDLLISDGGGLALCRRLKDEGHTRVLAVSSFASRDAALAHGADAFLQKPLEPLELVSTVRDLMRDSALVPGVNR